MSKTPNIVRRGIQGQAPEYALLGRLRGVGPVQFLTFEDVVTEMMSRGRLGQRIQAASSNGTDGFNPFAPGVPEISSWTVANGTGLALSEATPKSGMTQAIAVSAPGVATSPNIISVYRPAPVTLPYRISTAFTFSAANAATPGIGIGFWSPTRLENVMLEWNGTFLYVILNRYNSATSYNSTVSFRQLLTNAYPALLMGTVWISIYVTAGQVTYQYSPDGLHWDTIPGMTYAKAASFMSSVGWDNAAMMLHNTLASGAPVAGTFYCWDDDGLNRTPASVFG